MSRMHWWIAAVGAVFFLWFFIPAFVVVNIGNVTGMAVSALVLLYGIFFRQVQDVAGRLWQTRGGRAGLSVLGVVCFLVLLVVIAETAGMIRSAANRAPENTTAVVLGCSVKGERPSRVLTERLCAAYEYLNRNPEAVCVLSGGQGEGEGEEISEAECMYRYLTGRGIDGARLLLENRSTTTAENLQYSRELLEQHRIDGPVTIITSEFHEYRANETAKRLGITSYSTPGRTFFLYLPTFYVRELYGILYYKISNKG